ncbi:MAG: fibronectin type III domain-containing protein [Paludibacteraceae bacterium]|nr:fibronectin type III domain-containing protein [Paludibacteraceae bacterium]
MFLCAILLHGFLSCDRDDDPTRRIAETGDATDITAFTAKISGYCNQKNVAGLSVTYGIEYTNTDLTRNAIVLNASEMDEKGRFSVDIENLNPGTEYFYRTFVFYNRAYSFGNVESFTTLAHPEPEKVDLGVGVKWASFNISAPAPADYGKYYSWGEIRTKSFYAWESYLWSADGTESNITKYNSADNKNRLTSDDDVATHELGGSWRMPTAKEFDKLVAGCYWQWFENYKNSGIKGYVVFKAKNDGDRGKRNSETISASYSPDKDVHIFLPAAGYASKDVFSDIGSNGNYWTSSLSPSTSSSAYYIYFDSENIGVGECEKRYYGQSVRPVSD